jgi:hypothetical protein
MCQDTLAEWLRRRPAKPLGFARVGSNPTGVVTFSFLKYFYASKKNTTPAGFEPARAKPNRFLIYRLNHSATVSLRTTIFRRLIK